MTLLANEATADSRKLLKKHGRPDSTSYEELEQDLASLYFQTDDKKALEKELADIHPHKNWILKQYPAPVEVKKEEVVIVAEPEKKSQADGGDSNCNPMCRMRMSNCCGNSYSGFNGDQQSQFSKPTDYVGVIGMVAVVGALFFVLSKSVK